MGAHSDRGHCGPQHWTTYCQDGALLPPLQGVSYHPHFVDEDA
jgi:hypothetical protein